MACSAGTGTQVAAGHAFKYLWGLFFLAGWEEMVAGSFVRSHFLCVLCHFFSPPAGSGHRIRPAILSLPLASSRQVVSHSVLAVPSHLDSYSPRTDPASYTNKHAEMLFCHTALRVKPCEGPSWRRSGLQKVQTGLWNHVDLHPVRKQQHSGRAGDVTVSSVSLICTLCSKVKFKTWCLPMM